MSRVKQQFLYPEVVNEQVYPTIPPCSFNDANKRFGFGPEIELTRGSKDRSVIPIGRLAARNEGLSKNGF